MNSSCLTKLASIPGEPERCGSTGRRLRRCRMLENLIGLGLEIEAVRAIYRSWEKMTPAHRRGHGTPCAGRVPNESPTGEFVCQEKLSDYGIMCCMHRYARP